MIKRIYFLNIRLETGGPENIHQVCNVLANNGFDAKIFYNDLKKFHTERFKAYSNPIADNIIDNEETLFVFPEFLPASSFKQLKCKKALFWLSLDNSPDIKQLNLRQYLFDSGIDFCFTQSQYAYDYLTSYGIPNIFMLSDYINDKYFSKPSSNCRKPQILFNPKKGYDFTQKIINLNSDLVFVPIQNMTVDQVINLMDESMIYIDFGEHPGKDRIPREAALRNLIVITNRNGAAVNDVDVPIDNMFKIDNNLSQLGKISQILHDSIAKYEQYNQKFDSYRQKILNEKLKYSDSVLDVFNNIVS